MWGLRHHRPAGLCPVDSRSFYVVGYFEETKLRHIREGAPARITLYSGAETLQGHVSSIGRAIYDQSVETDSGPVPDIKPNVPWVRLAQRVPVRVEFDQLPKDITRSLAQPAPSPSDRDDEPGSSLGAIRRG